MSVSDPEQEERKQRGLDQPITYVSGSSATPHLHKVEGTLGHEYTVNMKDQTCTCVDFTNRHLPCKHVYFVCNYLKLQQQQIQLSSSSSCTKCEQCTKPIRSLVKVQFLLHPGQPAQTHYLQLHLECFRALFRNSSNNS